MRIRVAWVGLLLLTGAAVGLGALVLRGAPHHATAYPIARPSPGVRRVLPTLVPFLEERANAAVPASPGSRWFCAVRYLGNTLPRTTFDLYVWARCEEYGRNGGQVFRTTGWSLPAVVTLAKTGGRYLPTRERESGNGASWSGDVRHMFPERLLGVIDRMSSGKGIPPPLLQRAERELSGPAHVATG